MSSVRIGWLALPAFLAVLVLVGLGASTEPSERFQARGDQGQFDQPRFQPDADDGPADGDAGPLEPAPEQSESRGQPSEGEGGPPSEITIVGDNGEIVVRVDEDGRPILLTPADGEGGAVDLDPDDAVAIRLGDDGRLEVVPLDEVGPDDTVVVPADGGFDLLRPDGSLVEFRADGENGGITATEISPDGRSTELVPNPDGTVTLSDGTTVGPIDVADDPSAFERLIDRTRSLPWPWLVAALIALVGASVALAVHLHRRRPADDELGHLTPVTLSDDRLTQFLDSLARDPDPSRAVRVGFSAAERGLGGLPPRRADETPFEWQHRVEAAEPDVGPALGVACDLFARVRFAPGQATDADRQAMITALATLHEGGRGRSRRPATPVGVG